MTYHREGTHGGILRCHLCGSSKRPPEICPRENCKGRQLKLLGTGTQRLEEEVRRIMPGVKALRVDRDSVGSSHGEDFHKDLGNLVRSGDLDVLLGTQMLAKGLDFPDLTLVGVVNADASLAFPDFRAEERTYQLLVQVAGRAGRAERPGKVLIQTQQPEHPCLRAAAKQDFDAFYRQRIAERKDLAYPPFGRLAALILRSQDKAKALAAATELGQILEKEAAQLGKNKLQVLGPAPSPLVQVKSWWRYRLLVKASDSKILHKLLDPLVFSWRPKGSMLAVDVDPLNFL
jgi:primosomal protein N' (replication factor Y)